MSNDDFVSNLSERIKTVFDHQQDFIYEFVSEFDGCEIKSFYMGQDQCLLQVLDRKGGSSLITTIDTVKFINWLDGFAK